MKRKYVTPIIAMEYYNLTQSATACKVKIGFLSNTCVKNDADATAKMKELAWSEAFISTDDGGCFYVPDGMDENTGICYHTNVQAAFAS